MLPLSDRRRSAALAAACSALTFLVFIPALSFPFLHWDDRVNIADNSRLNFGVDGLRWMLTGSSLGHWHPLTWLTLAFDRELWGSAPFGYHLTNVLLHALGAGAFFLLARLLLSAPGARTDSADAGAFFAASAWALHPLRVESVAWATERRDVLSGLLILLCLLADGRAARAEAAPQARPWRRWAYGFGAAAMSSKVFAAVLPGALLLLDVRRTGRPRWRERAPWTILSAACLVLNAAAQARDSAAAPLSEFGLGARLAQAAYGLAFYAGRTLWPVGLGPLYERSPLLEPAPFVFSAGAVAAAAAAVWLLRKRFPSLLLTALAYLIFALPALGLFKSGRATAADRYSYLPALPLSLLAGAGYARLAEKGWARAAAAVLLLLLAAATRRQLPVWSSDEALWTRACQVSPLSYFARLKRAEAEADAGNAAAAAADRNAAARLHYAVFARAAEIDAARGDAAGAAAAAERAQAGLSRSVTGRREMIK